MKRIPSLALAAVLVLGAGGCSAADDAGDAADAVSDAASQASDAVSEASDAASDATEGAGDAASDAESIASDASSAAASLAAEASAAAAEVNWDQYPDQLRDRIDRWVEQDNCSGLSGLVDEFPVNQDKDLQAYVEARIQEAGCA